MRLASSIVAPFFLALVACNPSPSTKSAPNTSTASPPASTISAAVTSAPSPSPPPMSAGCGVAALPGVRTATIGTGNEARTYHVSIPEGYDASHAHTLIFAFHGDGGDGPSIRKRLNMETLAKDAVFVYPDAIVRHVWANEYNKHFASEDIPLMDAILSDVLRVLCIDFHRIFAVGFSGGAYFANELGCARGETFRAISAIEGGGPYGTCVGHTSVIIFHDTGDPAVPITEAWRTRDEWIKRNACSSDAGVTTDGACKTNTGCANGGEVVYCERGDNQHDIPPGARERTWAFFDVRR